MHKNLVSHSLLIFYITSIIKYIHISNTYKMFFIVLPSLNVCMSVSACRMLAISITLLPPSYSVQIAENTVLSLGSRHQHHDAHFRDFLRSAHPLHPTLDWGRQRSPAVPAPPAKPHLHLSLRVLELFLHCLPHGCC